MFCCFTFFAGYLKERSSIAVIGLSVHTAPVEMREKLAVPEAQWPRAIAELCNLNHISEAAVTSGIPVAELGQHPFVLLDSDATRHLFEVSAGVDSLVLGEGQILAQVKQAVRVGQGSGRLGKNIDRMFKDAITAGKRVRSETNIASGAVSVSSAAVELALMKLPKSHSASARMPVIGAGKMGKLIGDDALTKKLRKAVDELTGGIVNKLLHGPLQHLRCDGTDGRT
ncbi:hypothetical protein B296_00036924 [Ensete ventricosum]|uniref:Glutamyl-tRNA reductase N-terminal domain-containing protein n=1 Tax=Ensete ventricosum TaxID=4639 RepID=A0A426XW93_ENSVE|nr:hypothetical protein B296_00036924 [Ensete ventricosum]